MSRPTLDNDRSQSRRAKPQRNRRFARIAAVTTLAALAFVAGLLVDTTVILRFIFSCASGGCWRVPFWASIVAVAFFAVAVIVYFERVGEKTVPRSRREARRRKAGQRSSTRAATRRRSAQAEPEDVTKHSIDPVLGVVTPSRWEIPQR